MQTWFRSGLLMAGLLGLVVGCKSTHHDAHDEGIYHETPPPPQIDTHKPAGPALGGPPAGPGIAPPAGSGPVIGPTGGH
jgi:hypothetical protein